jgi:hypothetical protein
MPNPGHREGVRRYQRDGQTTLDLGRTLAAAPPPAWAPEEDIGTCQSCGAYWFLTGPSARLTCTCGGYVG